MQEDLDKKVFQKMGVSKEKILLDISLNTDTFSTISAPICENTYQTVSSL